LSTERGRLLMLSLAKEIEGSVDDGRLLTALLTALAIPDICGALDSANGSANRTAYAAWFEKYVAPMYLPSRRELFTGNDCYKCRCRLLHQGRTTGAGRYAEYEFLFEKMAGVADFGVSRLDEGKLLIEVPVLCRNIVYAIYDWLEAVEDTPLFKENSAEAVRMLRLSFPI
jgi:hypothetical protein